MQKQDRWTARPSYRDVRKHIVSLVCLLFHLFAQNLDESVAYRQTDGRTSRRTDGQTLLQGCNDASENFTDRYPPTYAQVHACMCLHTHQQVHAHIYTVTHTRRRNILLTEGAKKRAQGKKSTFDIFFPFFFSFYSQKNPNELKAIRRQNKIQTQGRFFALMHISMPVKSFFLNNFS